MDTSPDLYPTSPSLLSQPSPQSRSPYLNATGRRRPQKNIVRSRKSSTTSTTVSTPLTPDSPTVPPLLSQARPASQLQAVPRTNFEVYQDLLSTCPPPFDKMSLLSTQTLPSYLHALHRLAVSGSPASSPSSPAVASALHLQVSPPASVPLLRHERSELSTEAATLRLLSSAGLPVAHVIRHEPSVGNSLIGAPFLLTTSLPGVPLAHVLPHATRATRRAIDRQIDALGARIDNLRPALLACSGGGGGGGGASGVLIEKPFGPVDLVERGSGWASWAEAYRGMLGSVLKDGEDVFVNLPYAGIRAVIKREGARLALDEIREARLCVGGFGGPEAVLVDLDGEAGRSEALPEGDFTLVKDEGGRTLVTGLIGCKAAWWGDKALEVGALEWEEDFGRDTECFAGKVLGRDGWEIVSRCGEGKEVRALLYAVYHSVVDIVTSFYRPGREHMEVGARRKLTAALSRLAELTT